MTHIDCSGASGTSQARDALDPEQRAAHDAILLGKGDLRIAAGAGSGKTRTLVASVASLLAEANVVPQDVVLTTFTRAASEEMKARLAKLVGWGAVRTLRCGTFHALALRALQADDAARDLDLGRCIDLPKRDNELPSTRMLWSQVVTGYRAIDGLRDNGLNLAAVLEKRGLTPGDYALEADILRSQMIEQGTTEARTACLSINLPRFAEAWKLYETAKRALGAWDFADALFRWHRQLQAGDGVSGAKWVLVDEAQDNSLIQLTIAKLLAQHGGRLVLVGDARQAIYSWRGAAPYIFTEWAGETLALNTNYRSGSAIVGAGNALAQGRSWHVGGDTRARPRAPTGTLRVWDNERTAFTASRRVAQEIQANIRAGARPGEHAILLRTNALVGVYEAALLRAQVPCAVVGSKSFFAGKEVMDFMAYALLAWRDSPAALSRVINVPTRYLGRAYMDKLTKMIPSRQGIIPAIRASLGSLTRGSKTGAEALADQLAQLRALPWRYDLDDAAGTEQLTAPEAIRVLLSPAADAEADAAGTKDDATIARRAQQNENKAAVLLAAARIAETFATSQEFLRFAQMCTQSTQFQAEGVQAGANGRVTLSTAHRAKGLEWPHVYTDMTEGVLPTLRALDSTSRLDEERRLAYVIVTRAIESCTAVWCDETLNGSGGGPSQFLPAFAQEQDVTQD